MWLCGGRVSLVRLLDFFWICLNFYFLHLHVVKLTSCRSKRASQRGKKGRFKWLWMRRTQLLVPDGLLVWVFHTLLLIRWDFHCVATVPGGLQFSENEKKKTPSEPSETTSWRSKIESMYRSRPLGAEQSFHPNCLSEKSAVYHTDRPASPTNNFDFPTEPATFLRQHSEWQFQTLHQSPPTDDAQEKNALLRFCCDILNVLRLCLNEN